MTTVYIYSDQFQCSFLLLLWHVLYRCILLEDCRCGLELNEKEVETARDPPCYLLINLCESFEEDY